MMYTKQTMIKNATGLHARAAADFVGLAGKFQSKIVIRSLAEEEEANAKSIIMVLSLGLGQGSAVEISAQGEDEVEAVDALVALLDENIEG